MATTTRPDDDFTAATRGCSEILHYTQWYGLPLMLQCRTKLRKCLMWWMFPAHALIQCISHRYCILLGLNPANGHTNVMSGRCDAAPSVDLTRACLNHCWCGLLWPANWGFDMQLQNSWCTWVCESCVSVKTLTMATFMRMGRVILCFCVTIHAFNWLSLSLIL